ncbi:MAG TPA: hypothetical protein VKX17_18350 [Planctomycetota bacterium]|nr:hypothetical protein [Planctomycetota bacterium]
MIVFPLIRRFNLITGAPLAGSVKSTIRAEADDGRFRFLKENFHREERWAGLSGFTGLLGPEGPIGAWQNIRISIQAFSP